MLSPLQLRQHSFQEVAIKVVDAGTAEGEVTFEQQFACAFAIDNPLMWRGDLRVTIVSEREKPFSYSGVIAIRGIFEIHPAFPEARREDLIKVNGAGILFGAIREMVLTVTSRSLKGPLLLPTLNFQQAEEENQSLRARSKKHDRPSVAKRV